MYSNNWEEKKISELIEEFVRGISYSSEDISNPSGIPMMNLASIDKAGYYREGEMKFYSGRYSEANKVHSGEMLIACTDLTRDANIIGTPIKVPYGDDFYLFTMDLAKLTPRSELIDADFLYYALKTSTYRRYIKPWASGTNVLHLNLKGVYDYKLKFPKDISAQKSIASLLSNIDRKIALNRQINDNLEAMAKQLYDYWFVQFDFPNEEGKPYKSSGGKMVWNEKLKREIPEGWDADALNTWLEIKSGFPFKSETYQTTGRYKVITIKNVQDGELVTSGCDFVEEIPSRAKEYIALKIGDRLISLTGNCGRLCVVCEENLLLNQRVGLLSCNSLYLEYLYNLLNSQPMRMVVDNLANGAAQANLSPVELCKTIGAMPQEDTLLEYNRKANVFRLAMVQNNQEIATLAKQRDELLPLLMNGQVSVNYHLSDD